MSNQFSRTDALIGKENQDKLKKSTVAVFGLGGVGGHTIEALARSGIGHLVLVDYDSYDITNINRQIGALHSTIGRYKVDVMKERILDINPKCEVRVHKLFYLPKNSNTFNFEEYDYVIDAVDTVSAKIKLAYYYFPNTHFAMRKTFSVLLLLSYTYLQNKASSFFCSKPLITICL